MFFDVSASWLHEVKFSDPTGDRIKVSIFPFFDRAGRVAFRLIVVASRAEAYLIHGDRDLRMRIGGVAMAYPLHHAPRMTREALPLFKDLLHYDPWWVLRNPLFHARSWAPTLKATNRASAFTTPVTEMYFDRRLRTVKFLVFENQDAPVRYSAKYLEMQKEDQTSALQNQFWPDQEIKYRLKKGGWRLRKGPLNI